MKRQNSLKRERERVERGKIVTARREVNQAELNPGEAGLLVPGFSSTRHPGMDSTTTGTECSSNFS